MSTASAPLSKTDRILLFIVVPASLLVGFYGRFKGIGTWPLSVDEFYTSRSIDHILQSGWPRFPCGGLYTRGILFQYVVAGLRRCGLSPEFAGRFVPALASLAALPAAYWVGRRTHGRLVGWLVVVILSLSIWEIEMARFLRMYAPFQAVFMWYLVFYLRYVVDGHKQALRWMIGLSIVGVLTWEGGALLGLANVLAIVQSREGERLKAVDWRRIAGLLVLLVFLFLSTRDLRDLGAPAAADLDAGGGAPSRLQFALAWLSGLRQHRYWALAGLLPAGVALASLRWIGSYRPAWLTVCGLCVSLVAAIFHQFTLSAACLVLMLLAALIDWRELTRGGGRRFLLALLGWLLFWSIFYGWPHPRGALQDLFGFPNLYDDIVRPWGRTIPILFAGLVLGIAAAFWAAVREAREKRGPVAALLSLLVLLVIVIASTPTDRIETRYTFFLYPLLLVISLSALFAYGKRRAIPATLLAAAVLLYFAATEDFQPRHIVLIDSAPVNFRIGMSVARASHYYPRNDMRGVAEWLTKHVEPGDVVVGGIPNLDQYYPDFTYFYVDEQDDRYDAYICPDRRHERWTNHPLLYGPAQLKPIVASQRRVYVNVYPDTAERLTQAAAVEGWTITRVWTALDGKTDVLLIRPD
jgi:hypothetical protein